MSNHRPSPRVTPCLPTLAQCVLAPFMLALAVLALPGHALAQGAPPRALNPLAAIDKATLKGFVEKPLFEPSRQPPSVVAPIIQVAPPVVEPPPALRLIGIVEGARSLAAIIHRNDTGRTEMLHAGDHIGGWTVEVMPGILRVASGDRAFDFTMFRSGPMSGPILLAPVSPTGGPR